MSVSRWIQCEEIVKENCSVEFSGNTPQDDVMERLLRIEIESLQGADFDSRLLHGWKGWKPSVYGGSALILFCRLSKGNQFHFLLKEN